VQIKHSDRLCHLLDGRLLAKLKNGEWDGTFVEKHTSFQSSGASADNGDSWLREGHVRQPNGRKGHISSSIGTREENF
jgi:hypothetical protein